MDFLAKIHELQDQKAKIEKEINATVDAWVSAQGLSDGDKFIFKKGVEKGKKGQIDHGRYYRFLKKDETPNNNFGLQSFWIYDIEYAEIEKI